MDITRVGRPDGFPVVALHGIQGTSDSWTPLATALGDTFRFILPNMPGRGDAGPPLSARACNACEFARVTSEIIEQEVGHHAYVLAGWSMGVSVILEFMGHLADGTARHSPPVAVVLMSGTAQLNEVNWFASADETALLTEIRQREARLRLKRAADPRVVAWTWSALKPVSHLSNLAHVGVPALIVHGSDDEDCPLDHARRMREGIRRASLHVIPGGRHSILTENTWEVGIAMRDFLALHCAEPGPLINQQENS
ncbi:MULTISPECIES: alpha/beta fold hydrolase [Pandoraea]|uniref:Hydrolase n=1 Tax=Pandoraea communis TaxID=2508297 RepID=A0A5E4WYC5_9BURK|nr:MULTISPECIES: alpha/beta hydrolase [Pandoraea]EON12385.1 hydrolase [Pandoraea sp. SD6-2]VVE28165.1 hydrolase [Pandoraea communis]